MSFQTNDIPEEIAINLQRTRTQPFSDERLEIEYKLERQRYHRIPVVPVTTPSGIILVDWYTTSDPENPQNWSQKKKALVALQIFLYTFVVDCGSSIYVFGQLGVMAHFGVEETRASLGLALYALGYGLGPLIFAPMSEIPILGRSGPYIITFALYLLFSLGAALVDNFGGLMFLRFLQGFFGSPCLAKGAASLQDMYSFLYLPYTMGFWVVGMFAAPALGPVLSGFSVVVEGWRWSLWEILWAAGPVYILWIFCLPETSSNTILLYRARRLRKATGNDSIRSQSEIDQKGLSARTIAFNALIKPFEITIKDPAILFTNVYTALIYGIYFSYFEAFPFIYGPIYGFNQGETGLVFLSNFVGCLIGVVICFAYLHFSLILDIKKHGNRSPEWRLRPALPCVFIFTLCLFAFGWTVNVKIHWAISVVCLTFYATTNYIILQCIFIYVPMSYPQYAASIFAGNDFIRSAFAFAAVLFAPPMYQNLGIGQGISLLVGLSAIGIIGMWVLYLYGHKLRARSKFAID